MASEKKSHKAGKKLKSHSATNYKSSFRRYFNMCKKVAQHCKRQPKDKTAKAWLVGAKAILAMHYVRGADEVKNLHDAHYA